MALALIDHVIMCRHDAVHDAFEVNVNTTIPGRCGDGVIGMKGEGHDPGVVDPDVDTTKMIDGVVR